MFIKLYPYMRLHYDAQLRLLHLHEAFENGYRLSDNRFAKHQDIIAREAAKIPPPIRLTAIKKSISKKIKIYLVMIKILILAVV